MTDLKDVNAAEEELRNVAVQVLERFKESLESRAVTSTAPEIRTSGDTRPYTSEVEIYFWQNGDLIDVLEFFVFLDGQQVTTAEEAEDWLVREIPSVLERAS